MMPSSSKTKDAGGFARDAHRHERDARGFVTGVVTVAKGEHEADNLKELTESVVESCYDHVEALEGAMELTGKTFKKVVGRVPDDGPEVEEVAETAGNLMSDVAPSALRELVQTTTEVAGEAFMEEVTDTVAEMIPVAGVVMPTYNLVDGLVKAVVGAGGLAVGGTTADLGGLVGGLAAPVDGGATWGSAMKVAGRTSAWSASVAGEGTLTAVKGVAGFVNQVPGAQVATVPIKIISGVGANSVRKLRISGGEIESGIFDDNCEGAVTEDAMQVEKTYQLVSADGKLVLRATSTKPRRGYKKLLGHGGYSLTFGDIQSAEADEEASSFSFSGSPGAYHLHSGMHNNNTLFFIGATYPAQWVVWDVQGKTGEWEKLKLEWQEGGQKFKILGHGGQYVEWVPSKGIFEGGRTSAGGAPMCGCIDELPVLDDAACSGLTIEGIEPCNVDLRQTYSYSTDDEPNGPMGIDAGAHS
eukprot:g7678.t1